MWNNCLFNSKYCSVFLPGHNMYGEDITNFFAQHGQSKERSAHILMERIFPWRQNNFLVKSGMPFELSDVVGELGVYGVYIGYVFLLLFIYY